MLVVSQLLSFAADLVEFSGGDFPKINYFEAVYAKLIIECVSASIFFFFYIRFGV
jgi:hypothetical protein